MSPRRGQCGHPLSRDNTGDLCGACTVAARAQASSPLRMEPEFWDRSEVRSALAAQDWRTVLAEVQQASGASQVRIAEATGVSQAHISRIATGRVTDPSFSTVLAILTGLGAPVPFTGSGLQGPDTHKRTEPGELAAGCAACVSGSLCSHHRGDEEMHRREVIRLSLTGLLAAGPADLVRQSVDEILGHDRGEEEWELALLDNSHAILTQPAAAVRHTVLADLAAARQQLRRQASPHLRHVVARLSAQCANLSARLGDNQASRQWWATSRRAADASGDLDLAARVRGVEAAFALYASRPVTAVLMLTESALRIAGGRPEGMLCAGGARAQALASLGREAEAQQALRELTEATGDADGGHGWTSDSLAFVAAWTHAFTGTEQDTVDACAQVTAASNSFQNIANARLLGAVSSARHGDHRQAAATGAAVIEGLDPAYRTNMVMVTARRVLDAIPRSQRSTGVVRDFQELLRLSQ